MNAPIKKCIKTPKKLVVSLMFACLALFSVAHGEQYNGDGFSLEIPPEFTRGPSPHPKAVLVLRPKTQGFPTFNVVSESVALKSDLTPEEFGEIVLRGYKQVGFTDAAIKSIRRTDQNRWQAEIDYSQGNERFRAIVEGVNGAERHFILTFIDKEVTIDRSRFLQGTLAKSFFVITPTPIEEIKGFSLRSGIAIIVAFLAVFIVVMKFRRPKKNSIRSST